MDKSQVKNRIKNIVCQNVYYLSCVMLLFLLAGIICLIFPKEKVTFWVNAHCAKWMDVLILGLNQVGTLWFGVLVVLILLVWKKWKTALSAALCFITTSLFVNFLKYIVFPGTLRPTRYLAGQGAVLRLIEGVEPLQTESFPSGHTAAAFAIATVLALILSKKPYHGLLAVGAAMVGYGRIYLSQHFITDVYAGMIVGVCIPLIIMTFLFPSK
jgi:membrane-associated phospholipid phosphatase